jgi:hypothetical protein
VRDTPSAKDGRSALSSTALAIIAFVMTLLPSKRGLQGRGHPADRAARMRNFLIILSYKLRRSSPMSVTAVTGKGGAQE